MTAGPLAVQDRQLVAERDYLKLRSRAAAKAPGEPREEFRDDCDHPGDITTSSQESLDFSTLFELLVATSDDLVILLCGAKFCACGVSQWKALRTTNALERINEEFRRRTKTQASLPDEEAVLLLLFGLLRSGQVKLRRLVGCYDLTTVSERPEAA
jgi:Transposase, Mutator family